MSFVSISFILFILFAALLIYRDRKKIQFQGIMIIRKTKKGRDFIDNIAKKHIKFWNIYGTIGIGVSIFALIFGSWIMINNAVGILQGHITEGVRLVLPWPSSEPTLLPGILGLPWYIWIIGIISVVVPHEFAHGIMCRANKVKVKTIGWFVMLIVPGAFVEPDEKQLKKASRKTKLKVFSAGAFTNFVLTFVFIILGSLLVGIFYAKAGIMPAGIIAGYPVADANVSGAILEINGNPVNSQEELSIILDSIPPGTQIIIKTTNGEFEIVTIKHPELNKSFIGVNGPFRDNYEVKNPYQSAAPLIIFIQDLFMWIVVLNFGIGLINMLPIKPLDGGLFFEELLGKYTKKTKSIVKFVSILMAAVLVFNLIGPFIIQ